MKPLLFGHGNALFGKHRMRTAFIRSPCSLSPTDASRMVVDGYFSESQFLF